MMAMKVYQIRKNPGVQVSCLQPSMLCNRRERNNVKLLSLNVGLEEEASSDWGPEWNL